MTLEEGIMTFPVHWHPVFEITQLGRFHVEGRETRKLTLGTHTGTHVDAPRHFIAGGTTTTATTKKLLNEEGCQCCALSFCLFAFTTLRKLLNGLKN